jgi:hypothetical protein
MDIFSSFFETVGETAVVEGVNNEIKFTGFIVQGLKYNVLQKKQGICKKTVKGWLYNSESDDNTDIKDIYLELYNHLIKKEIIKKKVGFLSIFSGDAIYTINSSKINNIQQYVGTDLPESMKCYSINYSNLENFLKNYNYNLADDVSLLSKQTKGGKTRNKKIKRRNKTKNKHKK